MWLPSLPPSLSLPSSHSRVSSPSCASFTYPKQSSPGPGSLCPGPGNQSPPHSSWLYVCVCTHVCVCMCHHLCAVLGWCLPCTQPFPVMPPSSCCLHFHGSRSCTSLHTCHTHSNPETCPRFPSLTHLHIGPEGPPPMHTATSKSHPPKISQPDIHPSAVSKGSYPPCHT